MQIFLLQFAAVNYACTYLCFHAKRIPEEETTNVIGGTVFLGNFG